MKTAILALALFAATAAHAAKWVEIDDDDRLRVTVDLQSIKRTDANHVRVWMQYEWKVPLEFEPGTPYDSAKNLNLVDCANSTYLSKSTALYMGDRIVHSFDPAPKTKQAIPGSLMGNLIEALCSKK